MKRFDCIQDLMVALGFKINDDHDTYVKGEIRVPAYDLIGKTQDDVMRMAREKGWIVEGEQVTTETVTVGSGGVLFCHVNPIATAAPVEETVRMATITSKGDAQSIEESAERMRRRFERGVTRKFYSIPAPSENDLWPALHEPNMLSPWRLWQPPSLLSKPSVVQTEEIWIGGVLLIPGKDYMRYGNLIHLKSDGK